MGVIHEWMRIGNNETVKVSDLKPVPFTGFRQSVIAATASGGRLSALTARRFPGKSTLQILAVLSFPEEGELGVLSAELPEKYPSLTPDCPAAHWFEREMAEKWKVTPEGHPWLKPIRFEPSHGEPGTAADPRLIGKTVFFSMAGEESHEVAVGPVHAGVIEPGHFRFLCHGETVYHLEISLGYQHRGIERAMIPGPSARSAHYMETLAGDTSIGHAVAYSRNIEALAGIHVPPRADAIRAVAAELERMANHIGDLGAMSGDVGFLPTMNYCGRIRGDVLNMTALLCGNRFGRGLVRPGGVEWNLDYMLTKTLLTRLDAVEKDMNGAVGLMFETPSVMARFESTGSLSIDDARRVGLVGVAARACGLEQDVRYEFPYGLYRLSQLPVTTWHTGDCFSRAYVRWLEVQESIQFIRYCLAELPAGPIRRDLPKMKADSLAISLVEGWRGEICHIAMTDPESRLDFYKVIDPSFHNWFGLALALRGQQISDFPLCNKSFNLSYCGHDL